MKNIILKKIKQIAGQGEQEDLIKAQDLLMDYLKDNPQDTQAWLLLIRIECVSWFDDYDRIVHYVKHILFYDTSNVYALLFWAYANHYLSGDSDDGLYDELCMIHNDDPKIMSMIEFAKARHFEFRDSVKYENALKKSIEYWPYHTRNFCTLGYFYIEQGKIKEGNDLIEKGRENIKEFVVNPSMSEYDPTNIDEFLDEFFAGTITTML